MSPVLSGLAKTILQGTVKGGRRQGRQRKRCEDNIREWTGLEFCKSQRAVENREKWEKNGCKIICGAPTTLAVKGLMMMMNGSSGERGQGCSYMVLGHLHLKWFQWLLLCACCYADCAWWLSGENYDYFLGACCYTSFVGRWSIVNVVAMQVVPNGEMVWMMIFVCLLLCKLCLVVKHCEWWLLGACCSPDCDCR